MEFENILYLEPVLLSLCAQLPYEDLIRFRQCKNIFGDLLKHMEWTMRARISLSRVPVSLKTANFWDLARIRVFELKACRGCLKRYKSIKSVVGTPGGLRLIVCEDCRENSTRLRIVNRKEIKRQNNGSFKLKQIKLQKLDRVYMDPKGAYYWYQSDIDAISRNGK